MELTKTFTQEQFQSALDSWGFLDLTEKVPVFTSLFGDVFLSSAQGWWYLDTVEGAINQLWPSDEALQAALATEEGQDRYLLSGLAEAAARRGLVLKEAQVYTFVPPPVLGAGFQVENIHVYDFTIAVNLAGQVHDQVRNLPPGTRISGIHMEE